VTAQAAVYQHPIGPYTIEDWRAAEHPADGGRLELIWGYFVVSPPPGGPHQYATGAIYRALWDAVHTAGRGGDLYPVIGVGVEITSAMRTALIPDVALLNTKPTAVSFPPDALKLAVEVWSPGNKREERDTKIAAYAEAGVRWLWTITFSRLGKAEVQAYELTEGSYKELDIATEGVVSLPGPVPALLDLDELHP
jgi:Uma2 family endonuclease